MANMKVFGTLVVVSILILSAPALARKNTHEAEHKHGQGHHGIGGGNKHAMLPDNLPRHQKNGKGSKQEYHIVENIVKSLDADEPIEVKSNPVMDTNAPPCPEGDECFGVDAEETVSVQSVSHMSHAAMRCHCTSFS